MQPTTKRYSASQKRWALHQYRSGRSPIQIAKVIGCHQLTVGNWASAAGIRFARGKSPNNITACRAAGGPKFRISPERQALAHEILRLRKLGRPWLVIRKMLKLTSQTDVKWLSDWAIRKELAAQNIKQRGPR